MRETAQVACVSIDEGGKQLIVELFAFSLVMAEQFNGGDVGEPQVQQRQRTQGMEVGSAQIQSGTEESRSCKARIAGGNLF